MIQKIQGSQTDFSGGEFDADVKRSDNANSKAGGRQCSNFRILNSKVLSNRMGRSILFVQGGRTEEVLVAPGVVYRLCFGGDGSLVIRNSAGASVASQPAATYAWRTATLQQIVWDKIKIGATQVDVVICFPGQQMQVASFSGTAWTFAAFAFQIGRDGVAMLPFFRIAAPDITMLPSSNTGTVTITFSAPVLVAAHVGVIFRYCNLRLQIAVVTSPTVGTATWIDNGPPSQVLNFNPGASSNFRLGDEMIGASTGAKAVITGIVTTSQIVVQLLNNFGTGFILSEVVSSPNGSAGIVNISTAAMTAVAVWDEQIVSNARGWPQSVFSDQGRLGFCNLPSVPSAIAWSAEVLPYDFTVGANPTDAMVEIAPFNSQVLFVIPGPESSEFVFCDRAIFYIAISAINPLKPGSVSFQILSNDGTAANVQPRAVQEVIIYVDSTLVSIRSIVAIGAYNRPYETRALSDLHTHLIKSPIAIAVPTASVGFPERYGFVLNNDGTLAVFKYSQQAGQLQGMIGWTPWSGRGAVQWIAALAGDVLFSSIYSGVGVVEGLDVTQYLDMAFLVNNPPAALTPPGGKGPLWFAPSTTVTLMDLGTRQMGVYQVDANGFITPQFTGGENLASSQLVAGHDWTAIFEPFVPDANSGQDVGQRMFKRRVSRMAVYVMNSTGFLMARLFSGPITPTSPALGTIMNSYRVTTYNQGDDPTQAPPLREGTERSRPLGRSFDPRVAIIKDTPGPLLIAELGMEVTI